MFQDDMPPIIEPVLSENILDNFEGFTYSLFMQHFPELYHKLATLLPKDEVIFSNFDIETALGCEIVCATICHKVNWDFLRKVVYQKTVQMPQWVTPKYLEKIEIQEVYNLLSNYEKNERIQAAERCKMLKTLGQYLVASKKSYQKIFKQDNGLPQAYKHIYIFFRKCAPFGVDPESKKFQLVLQCVSNYRGFEFLSNYCKATVDYHLIRCFLRRGFILPKTQYAKEYIGNSSVTRMEQTVASLRNLCSEAIDELAYRTSLDIKTINKIEWWIGRSVCVEGMPDCYLRQNSSNWLKAQFNRCPFFDICYAINENVDFLRINEPQYRGNSF